MRLIDLIFCDDIRFEMHNKLSIMGAYSDKIVFKLGGENINWPLPIKLSVFMRLKKDAEEQDPENFEFEFFLNEKSLTKIEGKFNPKAHNTYVTLALNAAGLPLEPGYLGFSINILSKNKLLFTEKNFQALRILCEEF